MILKVSGIWLQDLHRVEGNRNSTLGGHKEQLVCTRTQSKEVTLQETEPDLPVSVKGSPAELWVSRDRGTGGSRPGSCHLTWVLLEVAIKPTIEPVESRTRSFQAKQPTRREHSHTHQQTIRFKFYWTQPCPPEQDPVFPTQFFPSGSLHKPLSCPYQSADRSKKNHNPTVVRTKTTL